MLWASEVVDGIEGTAIGQVKGCAVAKIAAKLGINKTVEAITEPIGAAVTAYKVADAILISQDIKSEIGISNGVQSTHVKSCQYPSPNIEIQTHLHIDGKNGLSEKVAKCGRSIGMAEPSRSGWVSLPSQDVTWEVSGPGMSRTDAKATSVSATNLSGIAQLSISPINTGECDGEEFSVPVEVNVKFDTAKLIASMGAEDLEYVGIGILSQAIENHVVPLAPATFNVKFHTRGGYEVDWSDGANHVWGTICSGLDNPFTLNFDSGGVITGAFAFAPASLLGGTVSETGSTAFVTYSGSGTYAVSGTSLSMPILEQKGTLCTPLGCQTYTLPGISNTLELVPTSKCN